jgi:hypothetical protein
MHRSGDDRDTPDFFFRRTNTDHSATSRIPQWHYAENSDRWVAARFAGSDVAHGGYRECA